MKLTFLGSRGSQAEFSANHQRHSALLIESGTQSLMLDCGSDWDSDVLAFQLDAIILTHAHDDHAGGIGPDIECPIYATAATWEILGRADIRHKRIFAPGQRLAFAELELLPHTIGHSFRAPAVSLRIDSPAGSVFYAPDIASLQDLEPMTGCMLYIGDGSCWDDSLLRKEQSVLCGHAAIPQQLAWCRDAGVTEAIFTHCGTGIVADPDGFQADLSARAAAAGICASFAHDGLVKQLSSR